MTIKNDVVLWDNGQVKFCLIPTPKDQQYKYIDDIPCITFDISYENSNFKGFDSFTLFDNFYSDIIEKIKTVHYSLNGAFRIDDIGGDTDGYMEFVMKRGLLKIKGQLGASCSSHSLQFEFEADQTLIMGLLQAIDP